MQPRPAPAPPQRICLLRLSAIGDVAHTVAVVRTLQTAFPAARLTWLVGRVESAVAALVPEVELVVVDKRRPLRELGRLRQQLRGRTFDVLLHLQVSFRSNLISLGVRAKERWGFDPARSKEGHGLVVNRRIAAAPPPGEHVLDGLMRFPLALGAVAPVRRWDLVLSPTDVRWAESVVTLGRVLAVNVCASRPVKDWRPERFAEVIHHASRVHGLQVVLCGGRTEHERATAVAILEQAAVPVTNLVGQTTLPQLIALLQRSCALLSPDSGPVHLATAVGTPVIGLYGATNLRRCGPSVNAQWSVDRYDAAARRLRGRPASALGWAEVVPGGMDLIAATDAIQQLDTLLAAGARPSA
jgi:heptosyltransferase I